jgi:hypothetical protein
VVALRRSAQLESVNELRQNVEAGAAALRRLRGCNHSGRLRKWRQPRWNQWIRRRYNHCYLSAVCVSGIADCHGERCVFCHGDCVGKRDVSDPNHFSWNSSHGINHDLHVSDERSLRRGTIYFTTSSSIAAGSISVPVTGSAGGAAAKASIPLNVVSGALSTPRMNNASSLFFSAYPNYIDILDVQHGASTLRFGLTETVSSTVAPWCTGSQNWKYRNVEPAVE